MRERLKTEKVKFKLQSLFDELNALFERKNYYACNALIDEILKLEPDNEKAQSLRAEIAERIKLQKINAQIDKANEAIKDNKYTEAKKYLDAAATIDPNNKDVRAMLIRLEEIMELLK